MTTVLIAPDKFKGSLSAAEVADTLADGLTGAGMDVLTLPLADGGDGSVAAALAAGFTAREVTVRSATGVDHRAVIAQRGDTAVIEVANTCGLQTLPGGQLDAMGSSSFGFGQAIRFAIDGGAHRIVLALGGSASSDAGVGMLAALGFRFFDATGERLDAGAQNLTRICRVEGPAALPGVELVVAGDVVNPLRGLDGAAAVYGPQKGASVSDVDALESGYDQFIEALTRSGWTDAAAAAELSGTGAAGGCGFAAALMGARIVSGARFFLDLLEFGKTCATADLVITGEGRLDSQTLHGKLPAEVAAQASPRPVIAVVGQNALGEGCPAPFAEVFAISDFSTTDTVGDSQATRQALRAVAVGIAGRMSIRS